MRNKNAYIQKVCITVWLMATCVLCACHVDSTSMESPSEENEFAINELKDNFRKIQQENIDVIKEMSIQTEKLKQIDYVIEQIGQMKEKYGRLISIFDDNQKEEDKFIEQYLGPKI